MAKCRLVETKTSKGRSPAPRQGHAAPRPVAAIARDGRGGTYLAWPEPTGGGRILAQPLLASGRRDRGWPAQGAVVSREAQQAGVAVEARMVEGARGTAIVSWTDEQTRCLAMMLTPTGPADSSTVVRFGWRAGGGTLERLPGPSATAERLTISPNPVLAGGSIRFVLTHSTPATLELLDLAGRRAWSRDVGSLGPGEHAVRLTEDVRLPRGIYFLRLSQEACSVTARVVVL